ncbi:MAG: DNA-binding protein [Candidatus Diapherotrites archaeon]|uniref:DNA-binding protein n=1 Tax=Candidatus Iainarchaeum sp. TaxID=3101447 RepID=A0A8T4L7H8_9ARCH|nr:DNA-binding protein [Candidatus Diapherotrites archaeon]
MAENVFVLKLKDDLDVVGEVERFCEKEHIKYGVLLGAVGKLKEFEVVAFRERGVIEKKFFREAHELNSVSGKIQWLGGKYTSHINVAVGEKSFRSINGQLMRGKAAGDLELTIRKVDLGKIIEA